jgi:hypothetical protein
MSAHAQGGFPFGLLSAPRLSNRWKQRQTIVVARYAWISDLFLMYSTESRLCMIAPAGRPSLSHPAQRSIRISDLT